MANIQAKKFSPDKRDNAFYLPIESKIIQDNKLSVGYDRSSIVVVTYDEAGNLKKESIDVSEFD